jgi:protein TonB
MHAALLLVLARSFGMMPQEIFDRGEGVVIEEQPEPELPPPLPPPNVEYQQPNVVIPRPDVPIDVESDPEQTISPPQDPQSVGEGTGGSAVVVPAIVSVRPDPRYPLTQPMYPPTDQRLGNQGSVDIEIYVLPNGRVGDARVLRSSGFERMDQSALDEAKRRWRMLPATRDGEPVAQWHSLRVVFKLKNQ